MRDGKAQSCSKQPLGAPTHQEPQHTSRSSWSLVLPQQSELRLVYNCNWWFVVLPCSDLAMAQPCLSTSLETTLKASWCFQPPWRIIFKDYATSMVLASQACCLACPCQEHRAISQSFRWLLWVLGARASTQQSLRSWDQNTADAHRRFGLELIQVPWSHPVPCLGKTSTDENGSMTKGREGKGMVSMWEKEKYYIKLFHG